MNFFYFSVIIGPILFIIGTGILIKRIVFLMSAETIDATIVEMKKGYIDNRRTYYPVVKYTDYSGKNRVFESDTGYATRSTYSVGEKIKCKYRFSNGKNEIHIFNVFSLFGISLIFMPIGALFGIIGFLGITKLG